MANNIRTWKRYMINNNNNNIGWRVCLSRTKPSPSPVCTRTRTTCPGGEREKEILRRVYLKILRANLKHNNMIMVLCTHSILLYCYIGIWYNDNIMCTAAYRYQTTRRIVIVSRALFFLSRTNIITIAILIIVAVFVSDYVKRLSRTQCTIFFYFRKRRSIVFFRNILWRIIKPTVEIARRRSVSLVISFQSFVFLHLRNIFVKKIT